MHKAVAAIYCKKWGEQTFTFNALLACISVARLCALGGIYGISCNNGDNKIVLINNFIILINVSYIIITIKSPFSLCTVHG